MKRGVVAFWSLFFAAAAFRIWQSFYVVPPDMATCLGQVVHGSGAVEEEPVQTETGQTLVVAVDSLMMSQEESCASGFLLRIRTALHPTFAYGDQVLFTGKILIPMNFQSGGRTFDYRGYLAKDNVFYEMKSAVVHGSVSAEVPANLGRNPVLKALFQIKRRFVGNIEHSLGDPQAGLAVGLVAGEKAALGKDLLDDFRAAGLIHIVVLSGYNITIVAVALRKLLSFLPRVWGIIVGGAGVFLFGILVGGGATVVRSCFMAGIALSADLMRRDYNVTRALVLAGLIMLIQNPAILLHDPSFQLSFLATVGLLLLAGPLESRLGFIPESFGMRGTVAATLATQIFVSPFILYTMGQISLVGMAVNILVLPFIPATMFFVFMCGAAGMLWAPLAQVFGWTSHLLLSYELFMVRTFAHLPFADMHLPAFSIWWMIGFYAVFAAGYMFLTGIKFRITARDS